MSFEHSDKHMHSMVIKLHPVTLKLVDGLAARMSMSRDATINQLVRIGARYMERTLNEMDR